MRVAYFDAFSGVSGDMTVGALIDAGADAHKLIHGLEHLGLGAKYRAEKTVRFGITATKFHVLIGDQPADHVHDHHHHHDHDHSHDHGHTHEQTHDHSHRGLTQILELIDKAKIPAPVKASASRVFTVLGEAEAAVHGLPIEKVHFHEVGAVDSIADIVGACYGLHLLKVDEVYSAPINVGSGTVKAAIGLVALLASGLNPKDRFTWFLEVVPAIIGFAVLVRTYRTFRLTDLLYTLILIHSLILMLGGCYTYAEVPLGFWVRDALGLTRNHYDRLGHFAQGFVPAMIARELFIRLDVIRTPAWRYFLTVCFCLGFSAFYELIEWWTALATGEAATAFLGTQGDVWDTQWDMFLALVGANVALLTLARWHDSQLRTVCENR